MKTAAFLIIVSVLPTTIRACLPRDLQNLAIAALCDFPKKDEQTTCQQVKIIDVKEFKASRGDQGKSQPAIYCVELRFVDLTGESGIAVVWLIKHPDSSLYEVYSGPFFEVHCQ
mgnify:CR=1 FL=1